MDRITKEQLEDLYIFTQYFNQPLLLTGTYN